MLLVAALLGYSNFTSNYPVIAVRTLVETVPENLTFAGFLSQHPPSQETPYFFLPTSEFRKEELASIANATDSSLFIFPNETFTLPDCQVQTEAPINITACTKITGLDVEGIMDLLSNSNYTTVAMVAFQELGKLDFSLPNPFTSNVWNGIFVSVFLILLICWAMVKFLVIDVQTRFAKKHN
jgi:hypothetical protein